MKMFDRFSAVVDAIRGKSATTFNLDTLFLTGQESPHFQGSGSGGLWTSKAYESSAIAFSCIRRQALDISNAPMLLLRDPEDISTAIEDPMTDRLGMLLYDPNPWYSRDQFIQYLVSMLLHRGEIFIVFDNPGNPKEMYPYFDPLYWKELTVDNRLQGWEYRKGQTYFKWFDDEVLHHRLISLSNPFRGQSPLMAAANNLMIDIYGDKLNAETIVQGGERGHVYTTKQPLNFKQQEELLNHLRSRRTGKGSPSRDMLLAGVELVDPKFTKSDLDILAIQGPSAEKICGVYGMSPALIFKDESPNYATFKERLKIYWTQTLLPLVSGIESAFDAYFVDHLKWGSYLRFDRSQIEALQDELAAQMEVAKQMFDMHIPVNAINERLDLGLDMNLIPGNDNALVPMTLVPISAVLDEGGAMLPEPTTEGSPPLSGRSPTNEEIKQRALDPRTSIRRNKKLVTLEKGLTSKYRGILLKYRHEAINMAKTSTSPSEFEKKLYTLNEPMIDDMLEAISPFWLEAMTEGTLSVIELIEDVPKEHADMFRRGPTISPEALGAVKRRENLIRGMPTKLFQTIMAAVRLAFEEELAYSAEDIARLVAHKFTANANRAITIGRTEVGSAFNVARFSEMKQQGFTEHQWLTAADEMVRGNDPNDPFNHVSSNDQVRVHGELFPSGLAYPMAEGGEAGNVINCRCLTIPYVR